MSDTTSIETAEAHAPDDGAAKPPRTPEEQAAHLRKKAAKAAKKRSKRLKRRLSLIVIALSVFLSWLGSTVFVMFHDVVAKDLGASHSRIKIALAGYSVALIMSAVAGGRVADIIGRKRMFVLGGLGFAAAAALGLAVTDLWSLFAVRAFMGFSAGLVLSASGGVLVSTMRGSTRHDAWLLWRGAGMAGMVLGPVVGPLIATGALWRQLFVADAVLMLAAVGLGAYAMKESRDEASALTPATIVSALLLGLGLLSPYLALLAVKEHVASWTLGIAIVAAGVGCLIAFVLVNRRSPHPLFDTDIVRHNRRMWITDVFGAIHVGALYIVVAAYPVMLAVGTGLSPAGIGIVMLVLTIPLISLHLLAHRLREQFGLTRPVETLIGCTLVTLSVAWWFAVAAKDPTVGMIAPSLLLMGGGFGLIRLFGHMGVIKTTGKRWASALFGTRTFSNHIGAAVGAIIVGLALPNVPAHGLAHHAQSIAAEAATVVAWCVAVVVGSAAIFAAFTDKFLGHEQPHWHAPKVPAVTR